MTYDEFGTAVDDAANAYKSDPLDDTPIPGMDEAWSKWKERPAVAPPPQPSACHAGVVSKIHRVGQFAITDEYGVPSNIFNATIDLKIIGGDEDGALAQFIQVNGLISKYTGTSVALDLVKSAGLTSPIVSNKDFKTALDHIVATSAIVRFPLDWEAFCQQCFQASICEQTNQTDYNVAKVMATKANRKVANAVALLAKSYKSFPVDKVTGKYIPVIKCGKNDAHGDVFARCKITRFLAPLG